MSPQPDGTLSVNFLGREYEISARGVNSKDGKPVHFNNRSVLAYYALSRGAGEPAFSYVPISHLAGKIVVSANIKWMTDPLGKKFSDNYREVLRNSAWIGCRFLRQAEIGRLFMDSEGTAENLPPNCLL